jgi:predicted ArsR family transcriptional regulator
MMSLRPCTNRDDLTGDELVDDILEMLRCHAPSGMTRSEIYRSFGYHKSAARLTRALGLLLERGRVRRMKGRNSKQGRPFEIWFLALAGDELVEELPIEFASKEKLAADVLEMLRRQVPDGMTRSEIYRSFSHHKSAAQLARALVLLLEQGRVRRLESRRVMRGRPFEIWFLVSSSRPCTKST